MTASKSRGPDNAVRIATYNDLGRYVRAFAGHDVSFVILVSNPGLGKTRVVRQAVDEEDVCWINGNATAFGIYCHLFEHRNKIVVIDDVDSLYSDRTAVRLIKGLCQTETTKLLAWHSDAKTLERRGIPRQFTTSSPVIIIANDWKTTNVNVSAIEDRGLVLMFEPPAIEVHRYAASFFWDQHVFDFIAQNLYRVSRPTLRSYVVASELREAGLPWTQYLLGQWLSGPTLILATILENPAHRSVAERIAAFKKQTALQSTQSYYDHLRKLQRRVEVPRITLRNERPTSASVLDGDELFRLLGRRFGQLGNG